MTLDIIPSFVLMYLEMRMGNAVLPSWSYSKFNSSSSYSGSCYSIIWIGFQDNNAFV